MAPPVQHRNILHFNPGNMSPRELEATFVGNETFLEELVSHVQKKRRRPDQKHLCLTGPRGIGKTTLLILLERRLGGGSAGDAIQVVRFAEEERQILSPHSFLKRLRELRPGLFPSDLANSSVVSWTKALLEGLANRNQDLVLLLDNLDHLLEAMVKGKEKGKEGDKKKADLHGPDVEKLLLSPHVIVVGTSLRGEKHLRDYSPDYIKGLYDHFEFRRVPGVTNIAMQLRARAEYDGDDYILEQLDRPAVHQRIRAVERLAEDNPRLVLFIYEYLSLKPLSDTYDLVEKLLNDVTPLYQDVLNRLVDPRPIHRAVLDKLMEPEGIATASEIAHELDIDTNPARTALRALADLGLVQVAGKQALGSGRPSDLFCVTPLLFWLWYSWRKGDQSVKALARAYTALASPPEIVGIISASQATSLTHQTQDLSRDTQAGHTSLVLSTTQQAMEQASNDCVDLFSGFIPEAAEDALGRGDYITVDRACQEAFSKESDSRRRRILELCIAYCNWIRRRQGSENLLTLTDELLEAHENKHESQKLRTDVRLVKSRILTYRNRREEARKELERALSEARKYPRLEVEILIDLAWLDRFEDSLSKAKERLEKALQMARRQAGNRTLEARALRSLGDLSMQINDLKEAQEVFDESLRIYLEIGNRLRQASTLTSLGELYHRVNRLVDAEKVYDEALQIYQKIDDRLGEANTLMSLGSLYHRIDRLADAEKFYEEALEIYQEIDNRLGEANTCCYLGELYHRVARLADAVNAYNEALSIYREIGIRLGEANTLQSVGNLLSEKGEHKYSVTELEKALNAHKSIEDSLGVGADLGYLGRAWLALHDHDKARSCLRQSQEVFQQTGTVWGLGLSWESLALVEAEAGCLTAAAAAAMEAARLFARIEDKDREASNRMLALSFSARALTREPGAVEEVLPRLLDMIGGLPDQVVADIIANELFLPLASRGRAGASEMAEVATVLRHEASLTLCRLLDVIDEAALQLGGAESSPKRPMIQQSVAAFLARAESLDLHSASVALQEGKIHQAVQKLDEALASKPDDANALAMLASAKLRMGKAEQALELIKGVPEKIRQTLAVSGALVLVYDELRLSKEFLQQLDDHRSRHGDDHNLEMALAESHASRSDWPAAAEHWQEALNRCASANDRPRIATRLIFALLLADRQKEVELYFNRYSENQFKDGERLLWMMVQCAALLLDGKMDSGKKLGLQVVDLWLSNPAEIQLPVNPAPLVQRLNDSLVGRDRYFFPLLLAVIAGKAEVRELLGTFFSSSMVQDTLEVMEKAGNNSLEGLRSGAIEQLGDVKRLTQLGAAEEAFFNGLAEAYSGLDDRSRRTAIGLVSQGLEASEPAVRKTALRCLGSLLPSLLGDELEQGFQVLMEFIRSEEQPRELRQAALKIGEIASDVWPGHVRQRFRSAAARLSDQIHNTPERT